MSEPTNKKLPWRDQKDGFRDALVYMTGRMRGEIKSFRTPWLKFNAATTDGIEWHSVTIIGGRPGAGKTLICDQIVREGFIINAGEDFRVLQFQFEMIARTSALREYSAFTGKSYKQLCSADGINESSVIEACHNYAKERVKYPIDVVEDPCTVPEFIQIIIQYMDANSYIDEGIKKYRKTMITLDHSLLMKLAPYKEKNDMLYALGEALTLLKRKYPIAFIILSQLNRDINKPERNEDGNYGNYVLESDIFGADALLQHADTLIGLNRPGKQKIRFYGPDRFIIQDDSVLALHFLKCRNGGTGIAFFKAEFHKSAVSEMDTPPMQEKRLRTS
jgi:replicative DNA helicase